MADNHEKVSNPTSPGFHSSSMMNGALLTTPENRPATNGTRIDRYCSDWSSRNTAGLWRS